METLYLDTSAFLKLYIPEKGSNWLQGFISGKDVVISQLVLFESSSALARRYREGTFTKRQASSLYGRIWKERLKYRIVLLGNSEQVNKVASLSFNLPSGLRLRTLDAIHLVVARMTLDEVNKLTPSLPFTFISADVQLLRVARTLGITTENPEDYA